MKKILSLFALPFLLLGCSSSNSSESSTLFSSEHKDQKEVTYNELSKVKLEKRTYLKAHISYSGSMRMDNKETSDTLEADINIVDKTAVISVNGKDSYKDTIPLSKEITLETGSFIETVFDDYLVSSLISEACYEHDREIASTSEKNDVCEFKYFTTPYALSRRVEGFVTKDLYCKYTQYMEFDEYGYMTLFHQRGDYFEKDKTTLTDFYDRTITSSYE